MGGGKGAAAILCHFIVSNNAALAPLIRALDHEINESIRHSEKRTLLRTPRPLLSGLICSIRNLLSLPSASFDSSQCQGLAGHIQPRKSATANLNGSIYR